MQKLRPVRGTGLGAPGWERLRGGGGSGGPLALVAVLGLDVDPDFLTVDRHGLLGFDAEQDASRRDLPDFDNDVPVDHDALAHLPRQHEHGPFLLASHSPSRPLHAAVSRERAQYTNDGIGVERIAAVKKPAPLRGPGLSLS